MLNLTRLPNENIIIQAGGEILTITVVEIRGQRVKLGITAPLHVQIDREEVYLSKHPELAKETLERR